LEPSNLSDFLFLFLFGLTTSATGWFPCERGATFVIRAFPSSATVIINPFDPRLS
jgi:hypothetical protein